MPRPVSHDDVSKALAEAVETVRIVGVVPFDINWDKVARSWAVNGHPRSISLMCESDNTLFAKAFVTDTATAASRVSFTEMKVARNVALDLAQLYSEAHPAHAELCADIRIVHLNMPLAVADIDSRRFVQMDIPGSTTLTQEVFAEDFLWQTTSEYLDFAFSGDGGLKYSAPVGDEVLEIWDHDGIPRGTFPRASFYDTDYTQLVVWALIFDKQGRMLIHRRAANAKDNRDMWDKSVGGHVDPEEDTPRTAVREVIEELFEDELKDDGTGFRPFEVAEDNVLYLGEWRADVRGRHIFKEASRYKKQWYFLKLRSGLRKYSPRVLPDGSIRRLRTRADVFAFVTDNITDDSLSSLKNSAYKLISLGELKSAMDLALAGKEVDGFDPTLAVPKFSPDLVEIMTGDLRDELLQFAELVRRYADGG